MSGYSYGVIEITPIRHKDGSVTFADSEGRIWWTEGQPVGVPIERRTVEGAPKVPTRAPSGRKRITKDDFRELVKSRKRRKAA